MSSVTIASGFSLTNRLLIYASLLLTPAQFVAGVGSYCPSNLGFLAYNFYNQVIWYQAIKANQLHALSLAPVHFNTIYCLTYLGGITSGHLVLGIPLGICTAGLMILNNVSAWISWAADQPQGFNEYQFYFFGWRVLNDGWHKFFLVWSISDTIEAVFLSIACVVLAVTIAHEEDWEDMGMDDYAKYFAIPLGAVVALVVLAPLIAWVETIVARNQIESPTDWVAVWLFGAQAVFLLLPSWRLSKRVIDCCLRRVP